MYIFLGQGHNVRPPNLKTTSGRIEVRGLFDLKKNHAAFAFDVSWYHKQTVCEWPGPAICLSFKHVKWARAWDFQQCGMCDQQNLRSAWAYTQSDQSLYLSLEYSMIVRQLTEYHLEDAEARPSLHM